MSNRETVKAQEETRPLVDNLEPIKGGTVDSNILEEKEPLEGGEEEEIKKYIVIVDSKEKTLDKAISTLRKGDYKVVGAESTEEFFDLTKTDIKRDEADMKAINPEEFWELQKGNLPDLIITDIDLKDLDGWEFIFRLKFENRFYEYRQIPIIIRTDEPVTVESVRKIQAESVHDYLTKSLDGKDLLQKVDKYFETRKKLAEIKKEISELLGYRVAQEYERISLAIRIRLKYLHALKGRLEELKTEGGDAAEIKRIDETYHLQRRELIKYERRKREIKKKLKVKKNERASREETQAD